MTIPSTIPNQPNLAVCLTFGNESCMFHVMILTFKNCGGERVLVGVACTSAGPADGDIGEGALVDSADPGIKA